MQKQEEHQSSQKQVAKRNLLLGNLLKRKRQKQADDLLQKLSANDEELLSGIKHNKFGAFCLQANSIDKAQQHLFKARQLIQKKLPCSNVYMNIGNLYASKKDYAKALQFYRKVVETSPYRQGFQDTYGEVVFCGKLNSYDAFIDAHTNMAVMLVQLDKVQEGLKLCQRALQLQPNNTQAQVNFTDFLRQVGRKQQAIEHTWNQIILYTKKNKDKQYKGFTPIKINTWQNKPKELKQQQKIINVLSVKWGVRYDAAYVNKLYGSIKRNTSWQVNFYCFTDDPNGLHNQINIVQLQEGWTKWWGKVTLFGCNIPGRKFYIDLDMVITGNLDDLFGYEGQFATLRTDDLVCQKNHKGGYNSSVMIWQDQNLKPVYDALKENFDIISKFIVRFDFWLQMTIANADFVQIVYPGQVLDFLAQCQDKVPQNGRVVCFARKPKPEDYPAQWIRQHWVQ